MEIKKSTIESNYLSQVEIQTLVNRIEELTTREKDSRMLIEIEKQSLSIDVRIGLVWDENLHIQVIGMQSIIDWDNYDF